MSHVHALKCHKQGTFATVTTVNRLLYKMAKNICQLLVKVNRIVELTNVKRESLAMKQQFLLQITPLFSMKQCQLFIEFVTDT